MKLKGNLILLLVAMIWGVAFVAQRAGMEYIGPFTYTGVRFALGCFSLLPLLYYFRDSKEEKDKQDSKTSAWKVGLFTGLIMCIAVSLQQIGLIYTTAGKAAFVTCLYIIFVPLVGFLLKQHISGSTWFGAFLSIIGLYFLCVKEGFYMEYGDLLVVGSAFFWTVHILVIDRYAKAINSIQLAFFQFFFCALFSGIVAIVTETISLASIIDCAVPIAYGGLMSVGVAYTLQIVGQKYAEPAHAAVIMSMETVFGALAGYFLLGEILGVRELAGCTLMMIGMLVTQMGGFKQLKEKIKRYQNSSATE